MEQGIKEFCDPLKETVATNKKQMKRTPEASNFWGALVWKSARKLKN